MLKRLLRVSTAIPLVAVVALFAGQADAQITYVDVDDTNALAWDGSAYGAFSPVAGQAGSADGNWDLRPGFANGSNVLQSGGSSVASDDAARLQVTVGGLMSGTYDVYAYFWSDPANWTLEASLTDNVGGDLPLFVRDSGAAVFDSFPANDAPEAVATDFNSSVLVAEGNRTLYQVSLGQVTGTEVVVYIDDWAAQTSQAERTWFDGIGYQAVPEPATATVLGLLALVIPVRRRRT